MNQLMKKNFQTLHFFDELWFNKFNILLEFILKYKSLQEIQQNPVWIKLQSKGIEKKQLNEQFLSLTEDEKVIAIDLFESLKIVMEDLLKKNNTQY